MLRPSVRDRRVGQLASYGQTTTFAEWIGFASKHTLEVVLPTIYDGQQLIPGKQQMRMGTGFPEESPGGLARLLLLTSVHRDIGTSTSLDVIVDVRLVSISVSPVSHHDGIVTSVLWTSSNS